MSGPANVIFHIILHAPTHPDVSGIQFTIDPVTSIRNCSSKTSLAASRPSANDWVRTVSFSMKMCESQDQVLYHTFYHFRYHHPTLLVNHSCNTATTNIEINLPSSHTGRQPLLLCPNDLNDRSLQQNFHTPGQRWDKIREYKRCTLHFPPW